MRCVAEPSAWLDELTERVRCLTCGGRYERDGVRVVGQRDDGYRVVRCTCHTCGSESMATVFVREVTISVSPSVSVRALPLTEDDVLRAHEILRHYGGNADGLFGAGRSHEGAFERAHRGTIFLDEIGELPIQVQPALLGALERRAFRRVGGARDIEVDVRVVAATHRDVRGEGNVDGFRADLYYRIAVARVVVPPLRERPDDIEALTRHFVTEMTGTSTLPFGPETMNALRAHRWSGNVRELRNVVEAAVAMGEVKLDKTRPGLAGKPAPATAGALPVAPYKEARAQVLSDFEQEYLSALITQCGGNASEAARLAGMDRQYLLGLLRRHGLR